VEPPSDASGLVPLRLEDAAVPPPDPAASPEGFIVQSADGTRIHFLDWGGPVDGPGVLLVPGLARTARDWTPVARRLRAGARVAVMDLRGHGLSDAPLEGYDARGMAEDVIAVIEGADLRRGREVVVAGHGFGALVGALAVARAPAGIAALVLVDGGWERLEETTGLDVDDALRSLDEPPEIMRSMAAYLADRRDWDPGTWDADQERAAREAVVETAAGRLVQSVRPHALEASVRLMYRYDPAILVDAPVALTVLAARDDDEGRRTAALAALARQRAAASRPPIRAAAFPHDGHNLLRYRPAGVAAAILCHFEVLA